MGKQSLGCKILKLSFKCSALNKQSLIVLCKMSCPSLAPHLCVSISLLFICLYATRRSTVPDAALPLVRLLVQFCNFLTVADCRAMHCQRVEVASYGMPFRKKLLRTQTREVLMRCNVLWPLCIMSIVVIRQRCL